jgi:hypothetical protein
METTTHEIEAKKTAGALAMAAKCAHAGCTCTVESGERYCSEYCLVQAERTDPDALATDGDEDGCGCGHKECKEAAKRVLVPAIVHGTMTG